MKSFAEFDHLHQTDAYDCSFGVISVFQTIDEASRKSHDILQNSTTYSQLRQKSTGKVTRSTTWQILVKFTTMIKRKALVACDWH